MSNTVKNEARQGTDVRPIFHFRAKGRIASGQRPQGLSNTVTSEARQG
jgi:hypothetical protein